jgi:hypothetical protein
MIAREALSRFQRVSSVLRTLPRGERRIVIQSLTGAIVPRLKHDTAEAAQTCKSILQTCGPDEDPCQLLRYVEDSIDLLDRQRAEDRKQQSTIEIVATVPRYLIRIKGRPLPKFYASLANKVTDIACSTRIQLDITVPYISYSGVEIYTKGLLPYSRRGLKVRVLTQLMTHYLDQNLDGILELNKRFTEAGAEIDIRSPTDAQAAEAGVHALIHNKNTIGDDAAAQVTANISRAAFREGLEGGVVVRGPAADELREKFDWEFTGHDAVDLPALVNRLAEIRAAKGIRKRDCAGP